MVFIVLSVNFLLDTACLQSSLFLCYHILTTIKDGIQIVKIQPLSSKVFW